VFENRVLREIFGTERDVVTGEWRKLHNEELLTKDLSAEEERDWLRIWHVWGEEKYLQGFGVEA